MINRLRLVYLRNLRYDRRKQKMVKLYRDRKGNYYKGFSKLTAKI